MQKDKIAKRQKGKKSKKRFNIWYQGSFALLRSFWPSDCHRVPDAMPRLWNFSDDKQILDGIVVTLILVDIFVEFENQ